MSETFTDTSPKQRLLDTAARLFHVQGYHETGINQIIDEAQVAKATFYKHFPSKDDLAVAWLKQMQAKTGNRFRNLVSDLNKPARQRILEIFDMVEESMLCHHFRGCPNQNMLSEITELEHPIRQQIRHYKLTERETFSQLAAQALGPDYSNQAPKLGDLLYFLLEGAMAEAQSHGSVDPIRRARYLASVMVDKAFSVAQPSFPD